MRTTRTLPSSLRLFGQFLLLGFFLTPVMAVGQNFEENVSDNCSPDDYEYADFWDNYYDPEAVFEIGKNIQQAFRDRDLDKIYSFINENENRLAPRKEVVLENGFSAAFDDEFVAAVLDERPSCRPVGWRGFMLGNGEIWFTSEGFIVRWGANSLFPKQDPLWVHEGKKISPECLPYEWWSGDNFEAIAEHFSFNDDDVFSRSTGQFIGREITDFEGIDSPWSEFGGPDKLYVVRDLDSCSYDEEDIQVSDSSVTYTIPVDSNARYLIKYRIVDSISIEYCQALAPNFNGRCVSSKRIIIGDWQGGSRGFTDTTYVYGIFETEDKKSYLLPLKSWFGTHEGELVE